VKSEESKRGLGQDPALILVVVTETPHASRIFVVEFGHAYHEAGCFLRQRSWDEAHLIDGYSPV